MSVYFAKIVNNVVEYVTRLEYKRILDEDGNENEELGINHIKKTIGNDDDFWLRTYRNGERRNCYAGIGYTYDSDRDVFIPPQPYSSWTFDEETLRWYPPVPRPADTDTTIYSWNEETTSWDATHLEQ